MVDHRNKIKRDFNTLLCEPSIIINKDWWYELFELFEGEPHDYSISGPATLQSLRRFDFKRIKSSSLRFFGVQVGIESFTKDFAKNAGHKETKRIIDALNYYGIASYATYLIGFDHHTKENVWDEMPSLLDLELTTCYILNVRPLPLTPFWYQLKNEKRLLDLPIDFYYIECFQSFTHPHFRPGFVDILPLMFELNRYFETVNGHSALNLIRLYENLIRHKPQFSDKFARELNLMKKLTDRHI